MHMVCHLHSGMMECVPDNGAIFETFAVTSRVMWGCILASALFSLMFTALLADADRDVLPGIRIVYGIDGHLINSRRVQTPTRLSKTTVHDLLIADDCAFKTTTEVDMQRSMDLLVAGFANFGLTITADKTVVIHKPSTNTQHCAPPRVFVDGNQLKTWRNLLISESHFPAT
ncbi:hypothetical protein SprV_0100189700 [Sparganum proliferum]